MDIMSNVVREGGNFTPAFHSCMMRDGDDLGGLCCKVVWKLRAKKGQFVAKIYLDVEISNY